jgi:Protein of unknown function (DUF4079)
MSFALPEPIKVYSQFLHPVLMWVLFALTLYAFYTGMKVRKIRSATGDEKKALIKEKFNDKHYQLGSLILALMVLGSIGAMGATYINAGKLFVNPHLIAGLSMTAMIAVSASLSPYMQKGVEWARYTHIALNTVIVGLFGWQAFTGVQIVQNILKRMAA